MRRMALIAGFLAAVLVAAPARASEKIKLPKGSGTPHFVAAAESATSVAPVNWRRRMARAYGYGARPYFYGAPYTSYYYTRPYYGYSYWGPGYGGWRGPAWGYGGLGYGGLGYGGYGYGPGWGGFGWW
jgi:hypothetical protein